MNTATKCMWCSRKSSLAAFTKVNNRHLFLCESCRDAYGFRVSTDEEIIFSPIEIAPGLTQTEHSCPALATEYKPSDIIIFLNNSKFFSDGECEFCGIKIISYKSWDEITSNIPAFVH